MEEKALFGAAGEKGFYLYLDYFAALFLKKEETNEDTGRPLWFYLDG